jgi:hypothetical protein
LSSLECCSFFIKLNIRLEKRYIKIITEENIHKKRVYKELEMFVRGKHEENEMIGII